MAKKPKEPEIFDTEQDEPEFHFADEDETPVFEQEAQTHSERGSKAGLWNRLKKQRLMLVILVLVVVYCLYQVGSVVTSWFQPTKEQLVPASPNSGQTNAAAQYQTQRLSTDLDQVQQSQQAVSTRLANLEQNRLASQQVLNDLQQQVAANTKQIEAMQTQLYGIDKSLLMLAQRLQPKTAAVPVKAKPALPVYYVKAIVPGRAWLGSQNGSAVITVSPGDTLGAYGRVTNIDPDTGTVGTTSGKTIKFGITER